MANASSTRELALEDSSLPTAKIERVERFGGLNYAGADFFSFVKRLEYVFRKTLTPKLLIMNQSCLIELVYVSLNADDNAFNLVAEFCEKNDNSSGVNLFLKTYFNRSTKEKKPTPA